ncbi:MAG: methyl-accepting chemotaxis protein, partial [Verrucomicrobiales bacterium]
MDSDSVPGSGASKPGSSPKLKPFLVNLPHHERRFLTALALIIESGKAKTVEDLIKYCQQAHEASAIDFIRNLAEQSKQATIQVRKILGEIQKATNSAVIVTEEGSKRVETGVELANSAGVNIHQLTEAIEESARMAKQIAASAKQQSIG